MKTFFITLGPGLFSIWAHSWVVNKIKCFQSSPCWTAGAEMRELQDPKFEYVTLNFLFEEILLQNCLTWSSNIEKEKKKLESTSRNKTELNTVLISCGILWILFNALIKMYPLTYRTIHYCKYGNNLCVQNETGIKLKPASWKKLNWAQSSSIAAFHKVCWMQW